MPLIELAIPNPYKSSSAKLVSSKSKELENANTTPRQKNAVPKTAARAKEGTPKLKAKDLANPKPLSRGLAQLENEVETKDGNGIPSKPSTSDLVKAENSLSKKSPSVSKRLSSSDIPKVNSAVGREPSGKVVPSGKPDRKISVEDHSMVKSKSLTTVNPNEKSVMSNTPHEFGEKIVAPTTAEQKPANLTPAITASTRRQSAIATTIANVLDQRKASSAAVPEESEENPTKNVPSANARRQSVISTAIANAIDQRKASTMSVPEEEEADTFKFVASNVRRERVIVTAFLEQRKRNSIIANGESTSMTTESSLSSTYSERPSLPAAFERRRSSMFASNIGKMSQESSMHKELSILVSKYEGISERETSSDSLNDGKPKEPDWHKGKRGPKKTLQQSIAARKIHQRYLQIYNVILWAHRVGTLGKNLLDKRLEALFSQNEPNQKKATLTEVLKDYTQILDASAIKRVIYP